LSAGVVLCVGASFGIVVERAQVQFFADAIRVFESDVVYEVGM
jgi:hypothetical protein